MWRAMALVLVMAGPVWAEAPRTSPIPPPRPFAAPVVDLAPVQRVISGQRPKPRPQGLVAQVAQPRQQQQPASAKGSVCGNPDIKGAALKPIKSRTKACNVAEPVLVSSVNGVKLMPAATINCKAAEALSTWIEGGAQPAYGNQIVALRVAASYVCRPRNNKRGAKISEHGAGNAIDIEAFVFANGKERAVLRGFDAKMRRAHKAACGPFNTTLGPGSDGMHENHLHLDVGRSGASRYCR